MSAIDVENLSIKFNIRFLNERMTSRRLALMLLQNLRRRDPSGQAQTQAHVSGVFTSTFWALKHINFKVERGEVVGLVGHNGAGKSTLLMALAGIYKPNTGHVKTDGSIGTLLSLGSGFNPELTGRENIELNYLFMGLKRARIKELMDSVIDFAELGQFIDAPLKTYSAGMRTRLGFSIAINLDPDIVLLDEVLEAGDEAFKKKAGNLLEYFKNQGKTVVIATHSLGAISKLCTRALLLDHGTIAADGDAREIINQYKLSCN